MSGPCEHDDARDRALLAAHSAGDAEAFGLLARSHYDRLWPLALRMCSWNEQDAEDALQEALISAMRAASGFRGDARVSTWLHRIVVNSCLDRARWRKRRPESELAQEALMVADPRDRIAELETTWEIERAIASLPEEQRTVIVLIDIEGWPVAEAAALLGIPSGTVKSRASRGRARLAADLGHLRNRPSPGVVEQDVGGQRPQQGGGAG